jgi:hypothetical protein
MNMDPLGRIGHDTLQSEDFPDFLEPDGVSEGTISMDVIANNGSVQTYGQPMAASGPASSFVDYEEEKTQSFDSTDRDQDGSETTMFPNEQQLPPHYMEHTDRVAPQSQYQQYPQPPFMFTQHSPQTMDESHGPNANNHFEMPTSPAHRYSPFEASHGMSHSVTTTLPTSPIRSPTTASSAIHSQSTRAPITPVLKCTLDVTALPPPVIEEETEVPNIQVRNIEERDQLTEEMVAQAFAECVGVQRIRLNPSMLAEF